MDQHDPQLKQSLSALLDNEADDLELRRVLQACEQDSDLVETWGRYSLVQTLLHEPAVLVSPKLSQKVAAALESEQTFVATPVAAVSNWQKNLSKMAVAASVALIFVVGVQFSLQNDAGPALVDQSSPGNSVALQPVTLLAERQPVELDPLARQLAEQHLREFLEAMAIDEEEPLPMAAIQDSPLYRLVNEIQAKP